MRPVVKPIAGTVLALLTGLASFSAAALGLGQIEVQSRIGEPLVAEIPIISSDPTELEQLQAALASPETFARIGLMPPVGIVADLRFTQALDARGNPIIRVTSSQPVNEPLLTFLVEVDWGQGRLVREYSALIETPRTFSAPLQPSIQAPAVEAPAVIERPAETSVAQTPEAPEPGPEPATPEAPDPNAVNPDAARPDSIAASPDAIPPPPVAPVAPLAPAPSAPAPESGQVQVQAGDSLSAIAGRLAGGASLDQTMIALLRANPEAFFDGNINRLKAGAVLRVPGGQALAELDPQQASALVNAQVQEWRDARRAMPQPAQDAAAPTAAQARPAAPAAQAGPRVAGARLEIVPPGASNATRAGTQSGMSAGGEGAMLQQELIQTKETLAAREAEAQELKSRVAELEKLKQQQQQLIAMKDSELAAAQERLAQTQKSQTQVGVMPWVFAGVGALALGLLLAWLLRRRDQATPKFRAVVATPAPSIADAFAPAPEAVIEPATVEVEDEPPPVRPVEAPRTPVPAWHTGNTPAQQGRLDPATQAAYERIELAQAYLDVGDLASARQLLGEVVINGDHAARQQATRMLRELE